MVADERAGSSGMRIVLPVLIGRVVFEKPFPLRGKPDITFAILFNVDRQIAEVLHAGEVIGLSVVEVDACHGSDPHITVLIFEDGVDAVLVEGRRVTGSRLVRPELPGLRVQYVQPTGVGTDP